jgi:hypothetical protein
MYPFLSPQNKIKDPELERHFLESMFKRKIPLKQYNALNKNTCTQFYDKMEVVKIEI